MKKGEQLYETILREVLAHVPNRTTSADELERAAKQFFPLEGVFPSDKVPKKKGYYIVNLDRSNQPGSHWVGVYRNSKTYAYDSFGREQLLPFKAAYTERDAEQSASESNCGARCIAWLTLVYNHGIRLGLQV